MNLWDILIILALCAAAALALRQILVRRKRGGCSCGGCEGCGAGGCSDCSGCSTDTPPDGTAKSK